MHRYFKVTYMPQRSGLLPSTGFKYFLSTTNNPPSRYGRRSWQYSLPGTRFPSEARLLPHTNRWNCSNFPSINRKDPCHGMVLRGSIRHGPGRGMRIIHAACDHRNAKRRLSRKTWKRASGIATQHTFRRLNFSPVKLQ